MAVTDPARVRREDPGNPDVCNVFSLHKFFTPQEELQSIDHLCRTAGIGFTHLHVDHTGGGSAPAESST